MTFNQDWKNTKFKELSPTWMEGPFYQRRNCTTPGQEKDIRNKQLAQDSGPDLYNHL